MKHTRHLVPGPEEERLGRPGAGGGTPATSAVLRLQREIGNSAVTALIQRQTPDVWTGAPDAKHRRRDDRWREYRAKRDKATASAGASDWKPPESEDEFDKLLDTWAGKAKAIAYFKIPEIGDPPKTLTEHDELYADLESAQAWVANYLEYVQDGIEWAKRVGDLTGLAIDLGPLESFVKKFDSHFGWVRNRLKNVQEFDRFVNALGQLASLDKLTIDNAEEWAKALKALNHASKPYQQWVKDTLTGFALRGGQLASRGAVVVSYVFVQVELALDALEAGVKVIRAYQRNKLAIADDPEKELMKREQERNRPKEPPPTPPGEWTTYKEGVAEWHKGRPGREAYQLRQLREKWREERQDAIDWGTRYFDEELFPAIYRRERGGLLRQLDRAYRKAGGLKGQVDPTDTNPHTWDEWHWLQILTETPDPVPRDRVRYEIGRFKALGSGNYWGWSDKAGRNVRSAPPAKCPHFEQLYRRELRKYLDRAQLTAPSR